MSVITIENFITIFVCSIGVGCVIGLTTYATNAIVNMFIKIAKN